MAFQGTFYSDWTTISIAVAAISVLGSSMLIMLSRLFNQKNLEQVAKTEFIYAASTVFIVIMVSGIITFGESALAGGGASLARSLYLATLQCNPNTPGLFPQETLIDWMKLYLATPSNCVQNFMNTLYALSVSIEAMATVYMEIFMSEQASGFGVKWIAERIGSTTKTLSFYMYMYYLIIHTLNFIKHYAGFFFSIGVALRAFPPTRGGGAYLMAISVGLYFVFPLAYILVAAMALPSSDIVVPEMENGACVIRNNEVGYICSLPEVESPQVYGCGASISKLGDLESQMIANSGTIQDFLDVSISGFLYHLLSAICLLPIISMVIMITFVLNTTNLFGGNIPEIGRGLVKLI